MMPDTVGLQSGISYSHGNSTVLHSASGSGCVAPGNWGALALGCTGGSCYSNNLANGYCAGLSVGNTIQSEPGVKTGPTTSGINARIQQAQQEYPNATWNSHTSDDPRIAIVPIVDWTGCSGRCSLTVQGFASVWVTGTSGSDINAIFIGQGVNGAPGTSVADTGVYHIALSN